MATLHVSDAQPMSGMQSSPADEEQLYDQLLALRDTIIAGRHSQLKLPSSAVESLKASQHAASVGAEQPGGHRTRRVVH